MAKTHTYRGVDIIPCKTPSSPKDGYRWWLMTAWMTEEDSHRVRTLRGAYAAVDEYLLDDAP